MLPTLQLLNQVANFIKNSKKQNYYCLFLLGKEVGLRVSEAVNFNLSLKKKSNLYLIRGKKHKKRAVFIDPQIISELKQNHWKPNKTNRFSFAHNLVLEGERKKRQVLEQQLEQKEVEITNYENQLRVERNQNANLNLELQEKDKKIQELSEQLRIMTDLIEQELTNQVEFPSKGQF